MVLNLQRKWLNCFPCLEQGPGKSRIAGKTDDSNPGKNKHKIMDDNLKQTGTGTYPTDTRVVDP